MHGYEPQLNLSDRNSTCPRLPQASQSQLNLANFVSTNVSVFIKSPGTEQFSLHNSHIVNLFTPLESVYMLISPFGTCRCPGHIISLNDAEMESQTSSSFSVSRFICEFRILMRLN